MAPGHLPLCRRARRRSRMRRARHPDKPARAPRLVAWLGTYRQPPAPSERGVGCLHSRGHRGEQAGAVPPVGPGGGTRQHLPPSPASPGRGAGCPPRTQEPRVACQGLGKSHPGALGGSVACAGPPGELCARNKHGAGEPCQRGGGLSLTNTQPAALVGSIRRAGGHLPALRSHPARPQPDIMGPQPAHATGARSSPFQRNSARGCFSMALLCAVTAAGGGQERRGRSGLGERALRPAGTAPPCCWPCRRSRSTRG